MRPGPRWLAALALLLCGCEAAPVARDAPRAADPPAAAAAAGAAAGAAATVPAAAPLPAPSAARQAVGFRTPRRLEEHFAKHGAEFGAATPQAYLALAQALRDRPAGGEVLELVRADGVITRFDRETGAFLAFERDGVIRTFFVPNDGERYFRRQAARPRR
jgi:pyocin large subunit-like protein